MHVVVTGAAGFIGQHVVSRLHAGGATVVAVDRHPPPRPHGVDALVGDLAASDSLPRLERTLAATDAVIHLAGRPGVRDPDPRAPRRRWRDNVLAAERVLEAAPPSTPVVVASSSSVYGGAPDRPSREGDPLRPRGGYARSKVALEQRCTARSRRGALVAVARPFTVAGAGQRADMALARWLDAATRGAPAAVLGGLDRRRDVTDVADVAEGLVRCAVRRVAGPVNLGTGVSHSLAELLDAVTDATGSRPDVRVVPAGPEEAPATLADTRRCAELLDLVPHTDLTALVRRQHLARTRPVEVVTV